MGSDIDLEEAIINRTHGCTVTQIEEIMDEAAISAARLQKSSVGKEQIDDAVDKIMVEVEKIAARRGQDLGNKPSTSKPPHTEIPSNNDHLDYHIWDSRGSQEAHTLFHGNPVPENSFLPNMSTNDQDQALRNKKETKDAIDRKGDCDSVSIIESVQMDMSLDSNSLDQQQISPQAQKRMKTSDAHIETPDLSLQSPALNTKPFVIDNVPPLFSNHLDESMGGKAATKYELYPDHKEKLSPSYSKLGRPRSPSAVHQNVIEWAVKSPTSAYDDGKNIKNAKVENNWLHRNSEAKATESRLEDQHNATGNTKSISKKGGLQNQKKKKKKKKNAKAKASRWGKSVAKYSINENKLGLNQEISIGEERVGKGSHECAKETPKSNENESRQDVIEQSKRSKPNLTRI